MVSDKEPTSLFDIGKVLSNIGGLHCRRVGGKNKRKFAHIVCIKMDLTPRGGKSYCSIPPTWPPRRNVQSTYYGLAVGLGDVVRPSIF